MKNERYKQIMIEMGMPESQSLLSALLQVANEVEQEIIKQQNKGFKGYTAEETEKIMEGIVYRTNKIRELEIEISKQQNKDAKLLDCAVRFGSQVEIDRQEYKNSLISGHRYLKTLESFFDNIRDLIKEED